MQSIRIARCITAAVGRRSYTSSSGDHVATPGDDPLQQLQAKPPKPSGPGAMLSRFRLNPEIASSLAKMIYHEFHRPTGERRGDAVDRGGWYDARQELEWIVQMAVADAATSTVQDPTDLVTVAVQRAVLQRVDQRKPMSYIIGTQPFFGTTITCRPPVLIPRNETEYWTRWLLDTHMRSLCDAKVPLRVLDMCCGTGCIGVALAVQCPNVQVLAVDVSKGAVGLANSNAVANDLPQHRYTAIESDMFSAVPTMYEGQFDIIVCNPPYILPSQLPELDRGVVAWEDGLALVGDDRHKGDPIAYYRDLFDAAPTFLRSKASRLEEPCFSSSDTVAAFTAMPQLVMEVGLQAEHVAFMFDGQRGAEGEEDDGGATVSPASNALVSSVVSALWGPATPKPGAAAGPTFIKAKQRRGNPIIDKDAVAAAMRQRRRAAAQRRGVDVNDEAEDESVHRGGVDAARAYKTPPEQWADVQMRLDPMQRPRLVCATLPQSW
jgi:HemK-like putative methylase